MIRTKAAFFHVLPEFRSLMPPPLSLPDAADALPAHRWDLLILNRAGCRALLASRSHTSCKTLLLPGDTAASITQLIQAEQVISVGLSSRNSITFSSLTDEHTLVCIQRTLLRADGSLLEPQELLMSVIPLPAEEQLLLVGARLLL